LQGHKTSLLSGGHCYKKGNKTATRSAYLRSIVSP